MKYHLILACCLLLPSVLYGMEEEEEEEEEDLQAAEEGRVEHNANFEEQLERIKRVLMQEILEGIRDHIGVLSEKEKNGLKEKLANFREGAGQDDIYFLGLLHQDSCNRIKQALGEVKGLRQVIRALIRRNRYENLKTTFYITCYTLFSLAITANSIACYFYRFS